MVKTNVVTLFYKVLILFLIPLLLNKFFYFYEKENLLGSPCRSDIDRL